MSRRGRPPVLALGLLLLSAPLAARGFVGFAAQIGALGLVVWALAAMVPAVASSLAAITRLLGTLGILVGTVAVELLLVLPARVSTAVPPSRSRTASITRSAAWA